MQGPRHIETLTAAFSADPGFVAAFPDPATRDRRLYRLFAGTARHCVRVGGVAIVDDGAGVGIWTTNETITIGIRDALRAGSPLIPLQVGIAGMWRLSAAEHEAAALTKGVIEAPFAYLMALAVVPGRQREGLGRRTVDAVAWQACESGFTRLALKTENDNNVALYEHLGFELMTAARSSVNGLTVTVMQRPIA